jgi:uncharacterized protein
VPYIDRISIYPVKSLNGVDVKSASLLSSGALNFDREFAIFDEQGRFVNGKRNAKVHLLRCQFYPDERTVSLQLPGSSWQQFHLDNEQNALVATLSDFFGFPVTLQQNRSMGFPDDTDSPGPTIISTATLAEVASWFPEITVDEMRRRIRANIEIADVPAFWEDQLFTEGDSSIGFRIGNVIVEGINPCQRCVVPTRDSLTGESYPNFQKIFLKKRQETLPSWVAVSRFNHFFRLSINTKISSEVGQKLEVGSDVEII